MNHPRPRHGSPVPPSALIAAAITAIVFVSFVVSLAPPARAEPGRRPAHCPPAPAREVGADGAGQLRRVLAQLRRDRAMARPGSDPLKLWRGALGFFLPFPGGNGRACATCHDPREGFSISPASVEARWQALQKRRRHDPCADDPLFRPLDADDGQADFTTLRARALFKVTVPLPPNVRLTDDSAATTVVLSRAAPPLNMLAHTGPYGSDRSAPTLEQQALAAVNMHMQPTTPPTEDFLESVAEFERHIFSSARVARLSRQIDAGAPDPRLDEPPLSPLERQGKARFDELCGKCHGGPAQVINRENRIFPPFDGSTNPPLLNVVISNPPPDGFLPSLLQAPDRDLPARRYTVTLPDGTSTILLSSDPGGVLTDPSALDKVAGRQVFNRFDIPQLRGINATAPYFHDHRARTLEEVLKHYQVFFRFINQVRGLPLPLIEDSDLQPIVAYMRRAL
jgi:cytochrome c peroxidase